VPPFNRPKLGRYALVVAGLQTRGLDSTSSTIITTSNPGLECGSPAPALAPNKTQSPNAQRQPCCRMQPTQVGGDTPLRLQRCRVSDHFQQGPKQIPYRARVTLFFLLAHRRPKNKKPRPFQISERAGLKEGKNFLPQSGRDRLHDRAIRIVILERPNIRAAQPSGHFPLHISHLQPHGERIVIGPERAGTRLV
jgi:hypothetical protein